MDERGGSPKGNKRLFQVVASLVIIIIVISALIFSFSYIISSIAPNLVNYKDVLLAVAVLLLGYVLITLFSRLIERSFSSTIGRSKAVSIKYLFSLISYTALAFVVFGILKVNVQNLILATGFAGVVVGLASSTVLSNIAGGFVLVMARPVSVGDRITYATWQYGAVVPSYPPKFYSSDLLVNGFTGVVENIGFLYVDIIMDDGRFVKVPAGIFVQAMILINSKNSSMRVRAKYEIEKSLEPDVVIPKIKEEIFKISSLTEGTTPEVTIYETTLNSYVLAVDVQANTQMEEPVRSEMLHTIMKTVNALRSAHPAAGK